MSKALVAADPRVEAVYMEINKGKKGGIPAKRSIRTCIY